MKRAKRSGLKRSLSGIDKKRKQFKSHFKKWLFFFISFPGSFKWLVYAGDKEAILKMAVLTNINQDSPLPPVTKLYS